MLGFEFLENFNYPYISRSITEFWRRWHISLSTWFRDYVYIPLGGSRHGRGKQICNLMIVWLLTGFWHGASWNFMLWGIYFGVILILEKFVLKPILERLPESASAWLRAGPDSVRLGAVRLYRSGCRVSLSEDDVRLGGGESDQRPDVVLSAGLRLAFGHHDSGPARRWVISFTKRRSAGVAGKA